MKLTTGIVAIAMMVGGSTAVFAAGQNPDVIDNARSTVKALQQQPAADAKLSSKPAPGAPAPAIKPAAIPGANSTPKPAAKATAAKPASTSGQNKLQGVKVVPGGKDIQIEISSSQAVTPRISNLSSPNRVLVELPETALGSAQSKIAVGSGGVKGVRIGMDGKTPPTTSVVVDLDKALSYELAPGSAGKLVLILHTQESGTTAAKNSAAPAPVQSAKSAPQPAKALPQTAKAVAQPAKSAAVAKVADVKAPAAKSAPAPKVADAKAPAAKPADAKLAAAKPAPVKPAVPAKVADAKSAPIKADSKPQAKTIVAAKPGPAIKAPVVPVTKTAEAPKPKQEEKKWAMTGKRDPFFSPVVQQSGSGCATGKKCLEIGNINLRGVVKSESGFIAVVTNNLNKAYFLRENDPVFNGYVLKITGDSVVFQETIQDKLGKSFTREVVKRIFTPAV